MRLSSRTTACTICEIPKSEHEQIVICKIPKSEDDQIEHIYLVGARKTNEGSGRRGISRRALWATANLSGGGGTSTVARPNQSCWLGSSPGGRGLNNQGIPSLGCGLATGNGGIPDRQHGDDGGDEKSEASSGGSSCKMRGLKGKRTQNPNK